MADGDFIGELCDVDVVAAIITGRVFISPLLSCEQIAQAIDLRLGPDFVVRKMERLTHFDPIDFSEKASRGSSEILRFYETVVKANPRDPFVLHPQHFVLGSTLEYVCLPNDITGNLQGRSGWAREGLIVHSTASFIHAGHKGNIVFELKNNGTIPIPLYAGMRIAQLRLSQLASSNVKGYEDRRDSKYKCNIGTSYGRPWEDWEFDGLKRHSHID